MEDLVKAITKFKKQLGEFSMDLYYNDLAPESECFVVKIHFHPSERIEHFRKESFRSALFAAYESILSKVFTFTDYTTRKD